VWTAKITDPDWVDCAQPYSFYHQFIKEYWAAGPSEESAAPIHRLCTLARKMGVKSFMIDDALQYNEITTEIAHLSENGDVDEGSVTAFRATFLCCEAGGLPNKVESNDVIGQATIITFPIADGERSYIYDAIFRLPSTGPEKVQLLNNHVPISRTFQIDVRGKTHSLPASYFCQQNGVTSICSHCAVRMLVRTCSDTPVTVPQLNDLWDVSFPLTSVGSQLIADALKHFGLRPITYNLVEKTPGIGDSKPETIWGLLALLADSASPAMLMLSGQSTAADHVVAVLGHTFNSDEWHPLGTTLHVNGQENTSSSHLWVDHLVIHDDLLGPYYCLSRAGLFPGSKAPLQPKRVIAVLLDGVEVSPIQAEDFAIIVLPDILKYAECTRLGRGRWWEYLLKSYERRIFRTTLVTRDEYLATLRPAATTGALKAHLRTLEQDLPERFWMCEVSLPNLLLANHAKLGEILIDASGIPDTENVLEGMLAVRLPSLLGWWHEEKDERLLALVSWPETDHRPILAPGRHSNRW
jgi:hypothetical protein